MSDGITSQASTSDNVYARLLDGAALARAPNCWQPRLPGVGQLRRPSNFDDRAASFLLRFYPATLTHLPIVSPFAQRLLSSGDIDLSQEQVLLKLGSDPFIVARLVGAANSLFFNRHQPIYNVVDAVKLIGVADTLSLIVEARPIRALPHQTRAISGIWLRALTSANVAKELCHFTDQRSLDPKAAFVAGLVHDIGHLLQADYDPQRFEPRSYDTREHEDDDDHSVLGESLAKAWSLPTLVGEAIRWHHRPTAAPTVDGALLSAIVNITDAIVYCLLNQASLNIERCTEALTVTGIDPMRLMRIYENDLKPMLAIGYTAAQLQSA